MADSITDSGREELYMPLHQGEKEILVQIARLLVNEKLMNPEEELRFLAFLKEER